MELTQKIELIHAIDKTELSVEDWGTVINQAKEKQTVQEGLDTNAITQDLLTMYEERTRFGKRLYNMKNLAQEFKISIGRVSKIIKANAEVR